MFSAFKLNQQGNSIQPCHAPFPILNQAQKKGRETLNAEFQGTARRDQKAFLDEQ